MNNRTLAVSIGFNILALCAFIYLFNREPPAVPSTKPAPQTSNPAEAPSVSPDEKPIAETEKTTSDQPTLTTVATPVVPPQVEPKPPEESMRWSDIASDDLETYIANMREISVPEETIRDIVHAAANKIYISQMAPFYSGRNTKEYWKKGPYSVRLSSEKMEKQRRLTKERDELLKSLLGADYRTKMEDDHAIRKESLFDFVTKDKRDALKELDARFSVEEREIREKKGGVLIYLEEDREKLKATRQAKYKELAKMLSPEELLQYKLHRSHSLSARLWRELKILEPSKREFDEVFKLEHDFLLEHGENVGMNAEERLAYNKKKATLNPEFAKVFSEERFAEYQKATNHQYRTVYNIAIRFDLGKSVADEVWEIRRTAEAEAVTLSQGPDSEWEQRNEALATLQKETETAVRKTFGEQAYEIYTNGYSSAWLTRLSYQRRPATAPDEDLIPQLERALKDLKALEGK